MAPHSPLVPQRLTRSLRSAEEDAEEFAFPLTLKAPKRLNLADLATRPTMNGAS